MNWDQLQSRWKQLKGGVKQRWGKLTRNALTTMAGKREQLERELQEKYAHDKALSEKELDDFAKSLEAKDTAPSVQDNLSPAKT